MCSPILTSRVIFGGRISPDLYQYSIVHEVLIKTNCRLGCKPHVDSFLHIPSTLGGHLETDYENGRGWLRKNYVKYSFNLEVIEGQCHMTWALQNLEMLAIICNCLQVRNHGICVFLSGFCRKWERKTERLPALVGWDFCSFSKELRLSPHLQIELRHTISASLASAKQKFQANHHRSHSFNQLNSTHDIWALPYKPQLGHSIVGTNEHIPKHIRPGLAVQVILWRFTMDWHNLPLLG